MNEGIREPRDLSTYTHSDLKGLFKHLGNRNIHPPYMAQHCMQILRHWVEKRIPLGLPIEPELFINAVMEEWGDKTHDAAEGRPFKRSVTHLCQSETP
jgi:hypothetical protein